jgi:hypothetical protein
VYENKLLLRQQADNSGRGRPSSGHLHALLARLEEQDARWLAQSASAADGGIGEIGDTIGDSDGSEDSAGEGHGFSGRGSSGRGSRGASSGCGAGGAGSGTGSGDESSSLSSLSGDE